MDRPQNHNPGKGQKRHNDEEDQKKQQDIRMYRQCKGDVQKLERQAYYSYINNIIEVNEDQDDNPSKQKRFWSYIKSLWKDNTGRIIDGLGLIRIFF